MSMNLPLLEWCEVPAGKVFIAPPRRDQQGNPSTDPPRSYDVAPFRVSKYPVTNQQYQRFIDHAQGFADSQWWDFSPEAQAWRQAHPKPKNPYTEGADHPREIVCWYDAVAFCRWLSTFLENPITLPTEQQWQRAAQGDDGRIFPWGNDYSDRKCNGGPSRRSAPVTAFPDGASPFGVMDMVGNVEQWCLNDYYAPDTVALDARPELRSYRGGSFNLGEGAFRVTERGGAVPHYEIGLVGFRLVWCLG